MAPHYNIYVGQCCWFFRSACDAAAVSLSTRNFRQLHTNFHFSDEWECPWLFALGKKHVRRRCSVSFMSYSIYSAVVVDPSFGWLRAVRESTVFICEQMTKVILLLVERNDHYTSAERSVGLTVRWDRYYTNELFQTTKPSFPLLVHVLWEEKMRDSLSYAVCAYTANYHHRRPPTSPVETRGRGFNI